NRGFHGLVRDFRISRGRRYAGNFTPEERFSQDEQTLVLLKLDGSQPTNGQVRNLVAGSPAATVRLTHFIPLADNGEVAGELPDGTVDLLRLVNVSTGTLEGENYQTGSYVETRALLGRSRILVPYRPPAEYDVELDLTREEGGGGAFLGLEIAGRPAI